jgi:hypothetical protein
VRSTAFDSPAYEAESARRFSDRPDDARSNLGFRCVVEDPTYFAPFCEAIITYGKDAYTGVPQGGGPASETCPKIGIDQNMYCQGTIPVTNVVFTAPAGATVDPNGCDPTADPALFVCQNPGTVSVEAECSQSLPGDPSCPPGYKQDGNVCKAKGGQGACLPGYTYDPVNQCCTTQSGQGTSFQLPVCPVGTYYLRGKNACVPYPAQGIVSVTETIGFADCEPKPGGDTTPSCTVSPTSCKYGFDKLNCCCLSVAGGCIP